MPPSNSAFSSAPAFATTSGCTYPDWNSLRMNATASSNCGVSILLTSLPLESLIQPPGTPNARWISSATEPNAHRPAFASVSCLPSASRSSAFFGGSAPSWSRMSLRYIIIQGKPSDGNGTALSCEFQTPYAQARVGRFASIGYAETLSPARCGVRSSNSLSAAWPNRVRLEMFQPGMQSSSGTLPAARIGPSLSP